MTSPSTPRTQGKRLEYFDPASGERYVPHVIEPAAGATRAAFALLTDAYCEEEVRGEKRTVLRLDPRLAPFKAAVLPLHRKPELRAGARPRPRAPRVVHVRLRRDRLRRQALPAP
jgi:glycyl-tRNA synthetase (class II)